MKTILSVIVICLQCAIISAQNITNTLGTGGLFTVKDNTATYLILNQGTGHLSLNKSLTLLNTSDNTIGVIYKGGVSFIHNYKAPGTVGGNTFIGSNSGNFSLSGGQIDYASYNTAVGSYSMLFLTTGYNNSAFGWKSLYSNTTGYDNSAFGINSLYSNNTGILNSAFGYNSLYSNTTGYNNSAFGDNSLYYNSTGNYNQAFGYYSLFYNTAGSYNSSFGNQSLSSNTTGSYNSSFSNESLSSNTTGYYNSAFGNASLYYNNTGSDNSAYGNGSLYFNVAGSYNSGFGSFSMKYNTGGNFNSAFGYGSLYSNTNGNVNAAFGYSSLSSNTTGIQNSSFGVSSGTGITTGNNNTTIGYNAQVPTGTSSNQVRIGNTTVTYAGVQVAWTITSDKRWKDNIMPVKLGLGFINKLNPVSYTRKNDESKKIEYGLIAQDVEEVLKQEGIDKPGMITIDDGGNYELRYNDLIAPIIKAVQELNEENEKLKIKNEELEEQLVKIRDIFNTITNEMQLLKENSVKEIKTVEK